MTKKKPGHSELPPPPATTADPTPPTDPTLPTEPADPQAELLRDGRSWVGPQEPAPPQPIDGLKPGRIVHTLDQGVLKAAIVAQVHDDVEGEITVRVQEPSGPTRAVRLPWAGKGATLAEGTWQWMYDGQAADRARTVKAQAFPPTV